jgi:putative flippase GtrA
VSAVWAGIISGTAAMINSFIFNKNFTFRAKKLSVFKLILFFVITAFGLYVIRPLIIYFFTSVWLWPSQVVYDITQWLRLPLSQEFDTRNLALLIAIIVVLFYNYLSYKFFVFNDEKK